MWHVVLSSLTSNQTRAPCPGNSLNHWTTREVLQVTTLAAPNSQQWLSQSREENERLTGRISLYFFLPFDWEIDTTLWSAKIFPLWGKKKACISCLLQKRANEICVRKSFLMCELGENKWEKIAALSLVEDFFKIQRGFRNFQDWTPHLLLAPYYTGQLIQQCI